MLDLIQSEMAPFDPPSPKTPPWNEGSLVMWDNTLLPGTRHKWTQPSLTPAGQAGTRFTMDGRLSWPRWLVTCRSCAIPRRVFTNSIINTRGPSDHVPVTYFQFHGTAPEITVFYLNLALYKFHYFLTYLQPFIWFSCFSYLCIKKVELLRRTFCSLKHSGHLEVIWRPTTFS